MNYNLDLDKDLLILALMIAADQRRRAAVKFKQGSAAWTELDDAAKALHKAADDLKRLPTPLEAAIGDKKPK